MTAKKTFEIFQQQFPWLQEDIVSYKKSREKGGIDLTMKDGTVLNYICLSKSNWILRRAD